LQRLRLTSFIHQSKARRLFVFIFYCLSTFAFTKGIQSAILPPANLIAELLPVSFVLYKAKDVVAGNFYWTNK
jgi:hypothetical protein